MSSVKTSGCGLWLRGISGIARACLKPDAAVLFPLFGEVDGAAAFGGATLAFDALDFLIEAVVYGEFFAGFYIAGTEVDDVALDDAGDEVRVAGVVDVFGAGAADGTVKTPVIIEREEIDHLAGVGATFGFAPTDAFAEILNHFATGRDEFARIETPAVNFRFCQLDLEAGVIRVDLRNTVCRRAMEPEQF